MRHLLIVLFLAFTTTLMSQDYSATVATIDAARKEGKPRTALAAAQEYYRAAADAGDEDHLVKALAYRSVFTAQVNEDGQDALVRLLRQELEATLDRPVVGAVLNYMLGQSYFNFAKRNSYRLRTNTAVTTDTLPGLDVPLADWKLTQLAAAAEKHLYDALELARAARTPLSAVPAIVANDSARLAERPTLYDLLVRDAMRQLSDPLLTVSDPEVSTPAQYLVNAAAFVALPLPEDENSGVYRKLKLYQELTNYHLGPVSPALLAVEEDRISYVRTLGVPDSAVLEALRRLQTTYADVPGGQVFLAEEAKLYAYKDGDALGDLPKVKALALLDQVEQPTPAVARQAAQVRQAILSKKLDVRTESVVPLGGDMLIQLSYKNVEKVYHRLYVAPDDGPEEELTGWRFNDQALEQLKKRQLVDRTEFKLPANDDYENHTTETHIRVPVSGRYYLLTSGHPDFDINKGPVALTSFQVSNLAVKQVPAETPNVFEVVDRTTGAAKANVRVAVETIEGYGRGKWKKDGKAKVNDEGRIEHRFRANDRYRFRITDLDNGDRLVTEATYASDRRYRNEDVNTFVTLFTDRQIYRPGQTVKVYGLGWQRNGDDLPSVRPGVSQPLILRDANYQKVATVEVTSDEYGRFNAAFTLPSGGLTGIFQVLGERGEIRFRVEEYKRPRFSVELTAPDYVVAGEEATVEGAAKLYAGPGVNAARVNYRVFLEEVRWWWWGRNDSERELVADGTTETDADGNFSVNFTPQVKRSASRKRYQYIIETDVADATGETHDAETTVSLRAEKPVVAISTPETLLDLSDTLLVMAAGSDDPVTVAFKITPVTKPGTALQGRLWDFPDRPLLQPKEYQRRFPNMASEETPELAEWQVAADPVYTGTLSLTEGEARLPLAMNGWPVGHYRIDFTYPDGSAGEPFTFATLSMATGELPAGERDFLAIDNKRPKVGETITATLLTVVDQSNVDGNWMSRKGWTSVNGSAARKLTTSYTVTEADRGGIELSLGYVRFGRAQKQEVRLPFGWDNKKLQISYATFRDKLRPGAPERWTITVKNADGSPVPAAALASMYDASLDQIAPAADWGFSPWPGFYANAGRVALLTDGSTFGNGRVNNVTPPTPTVPGLPALDLRPFSTSGFRNRPYAAAKMMRRSAAPTNYMDISEEAVSASVPMVAGSAPPPPPPPPKVKEVDPLMRDGAATKPGENPVQIRKNLRETAFWLPELKTDQDGNLQISFDSPEALTSWKFRLFAHDKELAYAFSEQTVRTQKELMVLPNVPRFVREGDEIALTARVNNMSEAALDATVTLELFDPATDQPLGSEVLSAFFPSSLTTGAAAGATAMTQQQRLEARSGASVAFTLTIPDGFSARGPLGYRIIARAGDFSDGEENVLPVLTDRTLVTVSQPFYLKKGQRKTVTVPVLGETTSATHRPVSYTFQAVTNPAWLALKSLPYLMEYPYDCTEQIANRFFANQLAYVTVSDKPVLEQVFRQWQQDSNALKSELERNASLKNALLTETPWVRAAQSESEQRARIGQLFDLKRLAEEQKAALTKLEQRQTDAGHFPWFPGGRPNRYVTQYVVETMARLGQLGAISSDQQATVTDLSRRAINYLDGEYATQYEKLVADMKRSGNKDWRESYRPSSSVVHYLYARALANTGITSPFTEGEAYAFYLERSLVSWLDYGLYEQALLTAMAAQLSKTVPQRNRTVAGQPVMAYAEKIVASLRERALRKDEFGMYWKYGRGYVWQNLPIETHCRLLEAFQLAGGTTEELDEMRLWLLTNKRTNRWSTTKSTAAAVYALLNTGTNWTDGPGKPLKVSYPDGGTRTSTLASRVRAAQESPEAMTGAFSVTATGNEVDAALATVKLKNPDNRLVWGGIFYQYTDIAEEVAAASDGPLSLARELFRRVPTDDGIRLEPITAAKPLAAGDRVTVKLTLRSDRDLDFVHLKDRRAATFEPIEQLSKYAYEGGLGYYFAPGDLATNFFIDHLPRGTYVLEYDLFATYSGSFSNGLGRVQCMYAPEFGGNTAGGRVLVE